MGNKDDYGMGLSSYCYRVGELLGMLATGKIDEASYDVELNRLEQESNESQIQ